MRLESIDEEFMLFARSLTKKQRAELDAVVNFLQHEGINHFQEADFSFNAEEPIDIRYRDMCFQVVHSDFGFQEQLGKSASNSDKPFVEGPSRERHQLWNDLIMEPLRRKAHYGLSAKGIILLLSSHLSATLVERDIQISKKLGFDRELSKLGFDSIYFVSPRETLKIYP